MANPHDPHRPFAGSHGEKALLGAGAASVPEPPRTFRPDEVPVPGFLPDLPGVRWELAWYHASVSRADATLGAVLRALRESGAEDRTLVVFLSDNASSFPFAKTNCWERSTRVPWVVRWPGRVAPASVDAEHFVAGIDVLPTLLEAAGLPVPDGLDGRSFLPLLAGRSQAGRDRLVTVMHRAWAGERREMRCIHAGDLGYLYNAWSDGTTVFHNEPQRGLAWRAMQRAADRDPAIRRRVEFFSYRTPEELYDFGADPDALHDLSDDPRHRGDLARLRGELAAWMARMRDPLEARFREHLASAGRAAG